MAADRAPAVAAPCPWWLRPVAGPLAVANATEGKTLGELTVPELVAWGAIVLYAVGVGVVAGRLAGNLAAVAVRGPGR